MGETSSLVERSGSACNLKLCPSAIRLAACVLLPLLASCSGSSTPKPPPAIDAQVDDQKLCGNPDWKEQHLGLWFDVCRRNAMYGG